MEPLLNSGTRRLSFLDHWTTGVLDPGSYPYPAQPYSLYLRTGKGSSVPSAQALKASTYNCGAKCSLWTLNPSSIGLVQDLFCVWGSDQELVFSLSVLQQLVFMQNIWQLRSPRRGFRAHRVSTAVKAWNLHVELVTGGIFKGSSCSTDWLVPLLKSPPVPLRALFGVLFLYIRWQRFLKLWVVHTSVFLSIRNHHGTLSFIINSNYSLSSAGNFCIRLFFRSQLNFEHQPSCRSFLFFFPVLEGSWCKAGVLCWPPHVRKFLTKKTKAEKWTAVIRARILSRGRNYAFIS